jgi:hypothetical protein
VEGPEHIFLAGGLHLLPRQRFPGGRIHRVQGDDVLPSQAVDRTVQLGLNAIAQADLPSDFARDSLFGSTSHQLQSLPHFLLGEDVHIGGLLEVNGQSFS